MLKAKETCENQFDNNKTNNLFAARRNLLQRCERKMKVASQKDDKNKLIDPFHARENVSKLEDKRKDF